MDDDAQQLGSMPMAAKENAFQELIGQYAFIILMCSRVCETINCAKCLKQLSGGPFIRLLTGVGTFQRALSANFEKYENLS
ncbi:hypothetical protein T10_3747 [Trichinella papuae]|uniref:Uncharacterized protein n=1 Tax=Trichinella papuae TaxID=268474 RepID=A0A0V1MQ03_9BILA|nr:hypothetical protein T10_3747 [Trichinella papuae]